MFNSSSKASMKRERPSKESEEAAQEEEQLAILVSLSQHLKL